MPDALQEVGVLHRPLDHQVDLAAEERDQTFPESEVLLGVVARGEVGKLDQEIHVTGRRIEVRARGGASSGVVGPIDGVMKSLAALPLRTMPEAA